jgi:hypothetical protein
VAGVSRQSLQIAHSLLLSSRGLTIFSQHLRWDTIVMLASSYIEATCSRTSLAVVKRDVAPTAPGLSVFAAMLQWYIMHRSTCRQVGRRQPVIVASPLQIAGPGPNSSVVRRAHGFCDLPLHSLVPEVGRERGVTTIRHRLFH